MLSVTKKVRMKDSSKRNELFVTFKGVKYGAFAGFVATWSISSVIVLTELLLGLNIGAFYSIIGISLGFEDITTATSIGFGLHLAIGILIGAIFGAIGIRWKKIRMLNPYKSSLVGMGAGVILWMVLFLPITFFLVQPAINSVTTILAVESQQAVFSEDLNQYIRNISLIAISFHLIWGAIFGIIASSLLRIRLFKIKQHYNNIINIDPNIRMVTICDSEGRTMYSRHAEGVKNLLTAEESKKSIEMAMTWWKARNELSQKIGKGKYVIAEYERIKRITMPFGEDYLLYLTTERQANHLNIINRIRKLEAGLNYSFS